MSQDVRLAWLCPHSIMDAPLDPQDEEGTVWRIPVPSLGGSSLTINGNTVPAGGYFSAAEVVSAQSGLYRVRNVATLTITSSGNRVSTVTFPAAEYTLDSLESKFRGVAGVRFFRTPDDRFGLRETQAIGAQSFLRLTGTALSELGLVQTGAQGRQVYPAWAVVRNAQTQTPNLLYFSEPVQTDWDVRLSTNTQVQYCARCQGSRIENDYRFDEKGAVKVVRGFDLLYQICLKAILTEVGSNPYFQSYGSNVMSAIGQKALVGVEFGIRDSVRRALSLIQDMQAQQSRSQIVTAEERLQQILSIDVNREPNDPSTIRVDVQVRSSSRKQISLQVFFTVPGSTTTTAIAPVNL